MSKTLFWYLFKDLLRIFFLASGTLAGIMSFGGLLRPLTENGLDAGQVGKMLTYLTPAMMAYSLPVAALFATTVVYGRLAADNELTACRAAGLSYWFIGSPAFVMGIVVGIFSLLLLCFIVPVFSLKVEQVIFSNFGKVIVSKIDRNHQIRFPAKGGDATVFAESARLLPYDAREGPDELVELTAPAIVSTEWRDAGVSGEVFPAPPTTDAQNRLRVPREFYTAARALVRIHPEGTGPSHNEPGQLSLLLEGGTKFPRVFNPGEVQGGVDAYTFGPVLLDSPIRENVKFMDIWRLARLAVEPAESQRVKTEIDNLVRIDEEQTFLNEVAADPNNFGTHYLKTGGASDEMYIISSLGPAPGRRRGDLVFSSSTADNSDAARQVNLSVTRGDETTLSAKGRELRVRASPDEVANRMVVTLELYDVSISTPGALANDVRTWSHTFDVPMDEQVLAVRRERNLKSYVNDPTLNAESAEKLNRLQVVIYNAVRSELNARASFAVSCLILVLVGCALGMMFRSGNFLSAFAVSFIPALMCITLVVAGQQTAEHIPGTLRPAFMEHNTPLHVGIALIWSGNVMVSAMAVGLVARLGRR